MNATASGDLEVSMILPLCVQWEPLTGRLVSVKLQLRTAEVWLVTSGGSVMMFGTLDEQRWKKEITHYP